MAWSDMNMKLKRIILKTLLVIVIIILGLALCLWLWWNEKPVITVDYVAKLNEMRKPADYRPEDDGADLFLKACSMAVACDGRLESILVRRWPGDMNDVEAGRAKAWVASNEPAIATLEQAMSKRYFWLRIESRGGSLMDANFPNLSGARILSRALICRGRLKAWQGDATGGLADMIEAGNTVMCLGEAPTFGELLLGMGLTSVCRHQCLDTISRVSLSSSQLAEVAAGIEAMGARWLPIDPMLGTYRLEFLDCVQTYFSVGWLGGGRILPRVLYDEEEAAYQRIGRGGFFHGYLSRLTPGMIHCGYDVSLSRRMGTLKKALAFAWASERRNATVKRYDEDIALLREAFKTDHVTRTIARGSPLAIVESHIKAYPFLEQPLHGLMQLSLLHNRFQNGLCGTVATIAVLRHKVEKGRLPDGWQDVVTNGYLKEMPIDRYSGSPFVYKKTAEGFTVYSVGEDGKDDGGDRKKDIVLWPVEKVN